MSKIVVITAPSGAGKTTLAQHLLQQNPQLHFSVSATTRKPRPLEQHGKDYYFISEQDFRRLIDEQAFLEWEEVYPGLLYGSLNSELQKGWKSGKTVLFDIDVKGALRLKQQFGNQALTLFVRPPSAAVLENRLQQRGTEPLERLQERLRRAREELQFEKYFDVTIVNDVLADAQKTADDLVRKFIAQETGG